MMASCWGKRNKRGFRLPDCGLGVTVPTSINPKPSAASASMYSPFLSKPAAKPIELGNFKPITSLGDEWEAGSSLVNFNF